MVSWQLFVPPIIGLADQGDFVRLLGPFGYAPEPKGPEHKYSFVTRTFVKDPGYRAREWEQITSEFIFVGITMAANKLLTGGERFDITLIGLVHACVFLIAFGCLLYVTRDISCYWLIWIAMLFVLTDVGYVAYWNSFYAEPASSLWYFFLLAETIAFCKKGAVSLQLVIGWNLFAILLILAKTQNAPLCVPLALFAFRMGAWTIDRRLRIAAYAGAMATFITGVFMYQALPPAPRVVNVYNTVFLAVLPESKDPGADLKALGLDPSAAKYSGTVAWSSSGGLTDGALVAALRDRLSPVTIVKFYSERPARLWRHIKSLQSAALSLRPEFCGNFEQSAGHAPGARSNRMALWSTFHERYLARVSTYIILSLAVFPFLGMMWWKRSDTPAAKRRIEAAICLSVLCLTAFLAAAFGDPWEPAKHQYLFNLLLDTCLIFALTSAVNELWPHARMEQSRHDAAHFLAERS